MFNLSGAINVLLLLVVRPRLLLFVPPVTEPATEPGSHSITSVAKYNLSLRPTAMDDKGERSWKPTFDGSGNTMALSPISPTTSTDGI
jgi:hypothetical protein